MTITRSANDPISTPRRTEGSQPVPKAKVTKTATPHPLQPAPSPPRPRKPHSVKRVTRSIARATLGDQPESTAHGSAPDQQTSTPAVATSHMVPLAGPNAPNITTQSPWSQLIQILVGSQEVSFVAHKHLLTQIPFFQRCLRNDWLEASDGIVRLREEEADAFAECMHWMYHTRLSCGILTLCQAAAVGKNPGDDMPDAINATSLAFVHTYVLAKKMGMEGLQNAVLDGVVSTWAGVTLGYREFVYIMENTEADDGMRQAVLQELAVRTVRYGWDDLETCSGVYDYLHGNFEAMKELTEAILKHGQTTTPSSAASKCRWHSHASTLRCA